MLVAGSRTWLLARPRPLEDHQLQQLRLELAEQRELQLVESMPTRNSNIVNRVPFWFGLV